MPTDATIIYYSSNREDPTFEARIQARLVTHAAGLPIISVTQNPSTLGTNICLGPITPSNVTLYRQLLAGAEAATTPFVINAESDFLYPPRVLHLSTAGTGSDLSLRTKTN